MATTKCHWLQMSSQICALCARYKIYHVITRISSRHAPKIIFIIMLISQYAKTITQTELRIQETTTKIEQQTPTITHQSALTKLAYK